jgi:hypothetical protein
VGRGSWPAHAGQADSVRVGRTVRDLAELRLAGCPGLHRRRWASRRVPALPPGEGR